MKETLYEMTNKYQAALADLESQDLSQEEIADSLVNFTDDIEEKCVSTALFIANRKYEISLISDEANRLKELSNNAAKRAKSMQGYIDRLSVYLKMSMESANIKEVPCTKLSIKIKGKSPELRFVDGVTIPDEFLETVVSEISLNGMIKKDLLAGKKFDFAYLGENTRLEIK